ncbi:MAG: hypothetical protein ABFD92_00105 [Planctomycetaceae bacterium]|nr:hypothetical protein [Planctomycetaceae bacterium]
MRKCPFVVLCIALAVLALSVPCRAQESDGDIALTQPAVAGVQGAVLPDVQSPPVGPPESVAPSAAIDLVLVGVLATVVTVVVQWLRKVKGIDESPKILPYLSVAVGVVCSAVYLVLFTTDDITARSMLAAVGTGVLAGLTACGLYSAVAKVVLEKIITTAGKRWIAVLLTALLCVAGCTQPPASVKDTLFGAQLTAEMAVKDAQAARPGTVWAAPAATASDAERLMIERQRTAVLLDACRSVDKNLTAILYYYRVSNFNPFQDTTPPESEAADGQ